MSRLAALAAMLVFCAQTLAAPEAAARLGVLLQGMRQIEADFHQTLLDEHDEVLQESAGRVVLQHPGRFRWETRSPFEQLVVSDGASVWQYDADLQQVVIRPLDRRADQVPSLLLSGEIEQVNRLYEISLLTGDAGVERFELLPRDPGGPFASLVIQFRDAVLERLEIADGMGQRTMVLFDAVHTIAKADESLFVFVTPDGVDELHDE
ncbi:MAG: outer membrane lipoprotein chaperone LolA [Pseudomonadales bacterium]|nr:outer membrane lipoprotein chaperone LolA [Pseudomonadales bacterium]